MAERLNKLYRVQDLKGLKYGTYQDPNEPWKWGNTLPFYESSSKKILNLLVINKQPMNSGDPMIKKPIQHINSLLPSCHFWVLLSTVPNEYYNVNIEPSKDNVQFVDLPFIFQQFCEFFDAVKIKKKICVSVGTIAAE